jgi:hypothetical protein
VVPRGLGLRERGLGPQNPVHGRGTPLASSRALRGPRHEHLGGTYREHGHGSPGSHRGCSSVRHPAVLGAFTASWRATSTSHTCVTARKNRSHKPKTGRSRGSSVATTSTSPTRTAPARPVQQTFSECHGWSLTRTGGRSRYRCVGEPEGQDREEVVQCAGSRQALTFNCGREQRLTDPGDGDQAKKHQVPVYQRRGTHSQRQANRQNQHGYRA